jgi:hypothetical protein
MTSIDRNGITTFCANFGELRKGEVRRIPLPRTPVNKDGQEPEDRSTIATTAAKAKR